MKSKKAQSNMWWIIIAAVIALIVMIILMVMFVDKSRGVEQGISGCESKGGICVSGGICPSSTLKTTTFDCAEGFDCCIGSPKSSNCQETVVDSTGKVWCK